MKRGDFFLNEKDIDAQDWSGAPKFDFFSRPPSWQRSEYF